MDATLMTDHPIQIFSEWFDAQGEHVRSQVVLYSWGMLPQQAGFTPPKTPLEALLQCGAFAEDLAKSEETFRAWLTAEPQRDRLWQLGKVLLVRSVVSFLLFKYGHDEGREATQAKRQEDAEHFERIAGQETDFTRIVRGDPAQASIEWTAAAESWKLLFSHALSDEVLEAWMAGALSPAETGK